MSRLYDRKYKEELLKRREATHGDFRNTAEAARRLKIVINNQFPAALSSVQTEALNMIGTKIARILCGDPNCAEHWRDIAGYAQLVLREVDKPQDKKPPSGLERDLSYSPSRPNLGEETSGS